MNCLFIRPHTYFSLSGVVRKRERRDLKKSFVGHGAALNTRQHNSSHQIRFSENHSLLQLLDESGVLLLLLAGLRRKLGYSGAWICTLVHSIKRLWCTIMCALMNKKKVYACTLYSVQHSPASEPPLWRPTPAEPSPPPRSQPARQDQV